MPFNPVKSSFAVASRGAGTSLRALDTGHRTISSVINPFSANGQFGGPLFMVSMFAGMFGLSKVSHYAGLPFKALYGVPARKIFDKENYKMPGEEPAPQPTKKHWYSRAKEVSAPVETPQEMSPLMSTKGVSQRMGNLSLMSWLALGSVAITTAYNFVHVKNNLKELKQMYADYSGIPVNEIKSRDVMFGKDMPACVKHARKQMVKKYGAGTIFSIAGVTLMPFLNRGGNWKKAFPAMAGGMLISELGGHLHVPDHVELLPMYKAMSEHQKSGQKIPEEAYRAYIESMHPALATTSPDRMIIVDELVKNYTEQQLTPVEILRRMERPQVGKDETPKASQFVYDLKEVENRLVAEGKIPPAGHKLSQTPALTTQSADVEVVGSATAKLASQRQGSEELSTATPDVEVVGKATAKIASQRQAISAPTVNTNQI